MGNTVNGFTAWYGRTIKAVNPPTKDEPKKKTQASMKLGPLLFFKCADLNRSIANCFASLKQEYHAAATHSDNEAFFVIVNQ